MGDCRAEGEVPGKTSGCGGAGAGAAHRQHSLQVDTSLSLSRKTRAKTAQTMVYSDSYRLSRQLPTVKTVADCQDSCKSSKTAITCTFTLQPCNINTPS